MKRCFWMCVVACVVQPMLGAALLLAVEGPVKVEVRKVGDAKYELLRGGKPYFVKGGGGSYSRETLAKVGGNSFRTWGMGQDTQKELDTAEKNGLTVTLGYWVGHKSDGFKYDNPEAVKKQIESVRAAVLKYKDHPAVLCWALGNEMERGDDTPRLWQHIEELAKMVHQLDPNHPTMTVIAELGGQKAKNIEQYCPSIDILGLNSYAGASSVVQRYVRDGGTKPVMITEFGPPGQWESPKTPFGAVIELTSTAKADAYRKSYEKAVLGNPGLCLGSYAFTWGFKVEATSTWYGMFLPDGSKTASVDTMQELWTGKPPANPCPVMSKLTLAGAAEVAGGDVVRATVETSDPRNSPLTIDWVLTGEQRTYAEAAHNLSAAQKLKDAIEKNGQKEVAIKLPPEPGVYRIYCYVRNNTGGAAVGSIAVRAKGK